MSRRDARQTRRAAGGLAPVALPSSIAGLAFWIEADKGVIGTNPVTQWNDMSAGANNLTPVITGPVLSAGGGPNGLNAMVFDGTGNTPMRNHAANLGNAATGQTIFSVQKTTSLAAQQISMLTSDNGTGGYGLSVDQQGSGERDVLAVNNAYVNDAGSATTGWEAWTVLGNGSAQTLRVNGAPRTTGALAASNDTGIRVGSYINAIFWNGSIWGVLVYSRALNAGEIATVEAYLRSKTKIW